MAGSKAQNTVVEEHGGEKLLILWQAGRREGWRERERTGTETDSDKRAGKDKNPPFQVTPPVTTSNRPQHW